MSKCEKHGCSWQRYTLIRRHSERKTLNVSQIKVFRVKNRKDSEDQVISLKPQVLLQNRNICTYRDARLITTLYGTKQWYTALCFVCSRRVSKAAVSVLNTNNWWNALFCERKASGSQYYLLSGPHRAAGSVFIQQHSQFGQPNEYVCGIKLTLVHTFLIIPVYCLYTQRNSFGIDVSFIYLTRLSDPQLVKTWLSLTFMFRHLNHNEAADGWSYFHFKCPSLHMSGTAFSISSIKRYRSGRPVCPIKVKPSTTFLVAKYG
jgi:hypothetical protein